MDLDKNQAPDRISPDSRFRFPWTRPTGWHLPIRAMRCQVARADVFPIGRGRRSAGVNSPESERCTGRHAFRRPALRRRKADFAAH